MPFFFNKNVAFILSDLYHKIEIIAYCSETIPDTMLHAGILTQELVACLKIAQSILIISRCHTVNRFKVLILSIQWKGSDFMCKNHKMVC
jgi:hypothetical protein